MIIKNFTMRDIDICCPDGRATVPMSKEGRDEEGNIVIIPGEADVSETILKAVADNAAVKWLFDNGELKAGGAEPEAEPAPATKTASKTAAPVTPPPA